MSNFTLCAVLTQKPSIRFMNLDFMFKNPTKKKIRSISIVPKKFFIYFLNLTNEKVAKKYKVLLLNTLIL